LIESLLYNYRKIFKLSIRSPIHITFSIDLLQYTKLLLRFFYSKKNTYHTSSFFVFTAFQESVWLRIFYMHNSSIKKYLYKNLYFSLKLKLNHINKNKKYKSHIIITNLETRNYFTYFTLSILICIINHFFFVIHDTYYIS
jgi:hypothetical protein